MAGKRVGKSTVAFARPPVVVAAGSVVGPMEGKGPLGSEFDVVKSDNVLGEGSFEKAEASLLREACEIAAYKAQVPMSRVDFLLAGDLLNQLISANFVARDLGVPFFGLFGACSTLVEALILGAMAIDGGFASRVLAACSSHHEAAERQYRFPVEFATQRPPTAQWTVTGAGAALLAESGQGPVITHATVGSVVDMGLKSPNDMGSAMAPAAAETIWRHLQDLGREPRYYDLIATGDLASLGKEVAEDLLRRVGVDVSGVYDDCGRMIYSPGQDAHAGGSGGGCQAAVFCGPLVKRLKAGELRRVLLVGTGALFSPTSCQQGQTIPAVAHAVALEGPGRGGEG
ncbi:MAG: stage V sporulation protein AD [Acetobacteraceae bacterium]|nr:stage V sporulation protein AD [Acetobacteraceae bacterium]